MSIDSKEFKPSAEIKVKEENKAENIETLAAIKEKETPISDDPWDKPIAKPIPQTIVGQQNIVKKTAVNVNKKRFFFNKI